MMISCQSSHGQDVAQQQRDRLFKAYMEVKKDIMEENFVGSKEHVVQFEKEVQNFRLKGLQLDDMMRLKKVSQTMKTDAASLKSAQDMKAMKLSFSAVTQSLFTIMETMKCTDEATTRRLKILTQRRCAIVANWSKEWLKLITPSQWPAIKTCTQYRNSKKELIKFYQLFFCFRNFDLQ